MTVSMHTGEQPFFFGCRGKYRLTETDLVIQRKLIGYGTRMARTGNPNGGEDPTWPTHAPGSDPSGRRRHTIPPSARKLRAER